MSIIVVHHLTPKWSEQVMVDPREDEILCVVRPSYKGDLSATIRLPMQGGDGRVLQIPISFDCWVGNAAKQHADGSNVWGLVRLGAGVWQVTPSIVSEEYGLHAYVVLCDVPEPAPFLQDVKPAEDVDSGHLRDEEPRLS